MDILHLPQGGGQTKVFYATAPAAGFAGYWQVWKKPKNCAFISMFGLAGAGSGGGGLSGGTGASRGGGSGGGTGGITRALFPAYLLPNELFILVGLGGAAPAGNTIGNAGGTTYVNIAPVTAADPTGCLIFVNGGGAGQKGTTSSAAAGSAGGIVTIGTSCIIGQNAITWSSVAGVAGATGGAPNSVGGSITPMTTIPISGGAGGGGAATDSLAAAGGNIVAAGRFPLIPGGTGHSTNCNGNAGMTFWSPFSSCGGSGGGNNGDAGVNSGVGGAGGQGGIGSGGAGGGGGITGGSGGPGGNGMVVISWW